MEKLTISNEKNHLLKIYNHIYTLETSDNHLKNIVEHFNFTSKLMENIVLDSGQTIDFFYNEMYFFIIIIFVFFLNLFLSFL